MSAAEHEREADVHARTADTHAEQYDPEAAQTTSRCSASRGRLATAEVCWTSVENPTEEHLREAEEHRRHAADHRAGSEALRNAEARACAGIAPDDRDLSPFIHTEDVASVEALTEGASPRGGPDRTVGARVVFRALPGMTGEWLQRVVDCHLARNAALGHDAAWMPRCPLVPRGASARVSSTGNGFAVEIRAEDPASRAEIWSRARSLAP